MKLKYIMFTKHLEGLDVTGIIKALQSVGVAGADLCVRPGYPVNPENVEKALPAAAKQFATEGLSIPLVTTPGDFVDPNIDYAEPLYAACQKAGVGNIKLGYWHWSKENGGYWPAVERIRQLLEGFQELSKKYGVKTCIHNHSGASMGLNSCAAMNLVKGFDPQCIGVFADPGHLSIVGEPIAMALDIVKDYLAVLAFKDLMRAPGTGVKVVRIGQGFVDWKSLLQTLSEINFNGPVSFHSEYSGEPVDTVIDLARIDVRFINGLIEKL
ncbi:sugar phosphate isomerase/epimerase [Candidatus Poribacteria bacterium]|nr:sugar phosphate isomerase/epimerase [Candidatus Poribacteria bacterium]